MFHPIPTEIKERMEYLEAIDAVDRRNGTPRLQRLRQIPPETGRFLALLLAGAPEGPIVEIGTSAGYSTLWLSLAARTLGRKIHTFELLEEKIKLAKETFQAAKVEDAVELVEGDALLNLAPYSGISFCFINCEKDLYAPAYDLIIPKMAAGGLLVIDNVVSHGEELKEFIDSVLNDTRVDAVIVPIGKGELLCRVLGGPVIGGGKERT